MRGEPGVGVGVFGRQVRDGVGVLRVFEIRPRVLAIACDGMPSVLVLGSSGRHDRSIVAYTSNFGLLMVWTFLRLFARTRSLAAVHAVFELADSRGVNNPTRR